MNLTIRNKNLDSLVKNPRFHVAVLFLLMLLFFSFSTITPQDDGFNYQAFTEIIAKEGKVDLSIAGFHGADFFAVPIYLVIKSPLSVYYLDIILALFALPVFYLAFRAIFQSEKAGVLAACAYALSPINYTNALRCGHQTAFLFFTMLGLWLLYTRPKFSFLIGISYIIKPFSIALAPLFIYKKQYKQLALSLIFPVVYMVAQYAQIGRLLVGSHPELNASSLISAQRFLFNAVYAFQNYISAHGFSPFNNVYMGDMIRMSPFITFFAILAVLYYKKYFQNLNFFYAVSACAVIAFLIPTSFFRFDYWYYEIFSLTLLILAVRPIFEYYRILPIIVASSFLQFYYLTLASSGIFANQISIMFLFAIPFYVLFLSIFFVFNSEKKVISSSAILID